MKFYPEKRQWLGLFIGKGLTNNGVAIVTKESINDDNVVTLRLYHQEKTIDEDDPGWNTTAEVIDELDF